jgi:putative ABC transport system permease protein
MRRSVLSPMFWRIVWRNATVRPGRTAMAVLALAVAATASAALLNLYVDLDAKLNREFRRFGANIILISSGDGSASAAAIQAHLGPEDLVVPIAYAAAKTSAGQPVVVAGADLVLLRRMNPAWAVSEDAAPGAPLIGVKAAGALSREQPPHSLSFDGRTFNLPSGASLRTGASEDSQIFIPLPDFTSWTGLQPTTFEILVQGSPAEVRSALDRLRAAFPAADVRPVRQVSEAQTAVLGRTRGIMLASAALIDLLVALCVLATLTASVLERRKDFAVMKALGSSQAEVNSLFLIEALVLGILGGTLGTAAGLVLAAVIGRVNFQAAVEPRWIVVPVILAACVLLSLLSAALPLARLHRIQPAVMLKGE